MIYLTFVNFIVFIVASQAMHKKYNKKIKEILTRIKKDYIFNDFEEQTKKLKRKEKHRISYNFFSNNLFFETYMGIISFDFLVMIFYTFVGLTVMVINESTPLMKASFIMAIINVIFLLNTVFFIYLYKKSDLLNKSHNEILLMFYDFEDKYYGLKLLYLLEKEQFNIFKTLNNFEKLNVCLSLRTLIKLKDFIEDEDDYRIINEKKKVKNLIDKISERKINKILKEGEDIV